MHGIILLFTWHLEVLKAAFPPGICSTKRIIITITITKTDAPCDDSPAMSQWVVTLNLEGHCLVRLLGIMSDNPSANIGNLTRMALAVSQFVASKASNYLVPLVLGHLHFDPGVAIAAM